MSEILKDEQVKPMDRAVWNIEHILKFPASKHLRYHGRDVTYIDYYLPFVIVFTTCTLVLYIIKKIFEKLFAILFNPFFTDKFKREWCTVGNNT